MTCSSTTLESLRLVSLWWSDTVVVFNVLGPTIDWKIEDVKAVYDANVFSIIRLCSAVIPHMAKRRKGTIVNMGSLVGE